MGDFFRYIVGETGPGDVHHPRDQSVFRKLFVQDPEDVEVGSRVAVPEGVRPGRTGGRQWSPEVPHKNPSRLVRGDTVVLGGLPRKLR